MDDIDRRSAFALGVTAAATSALAPAPAAAARARGPAAGKEVAPGVREVVLAEIPSTIPGFRTVRLLDYVLQPGAAIAPEAMEHPMVCHMLEGQLEVTKDGQRFTARKNDMWTCATGTTEGDANKGRSVAIMRVVEFMA